MCKDRKKIKLKNVGKKEKADRKRERKRLPEMKRGRKKDQKTDTSKRINWE